MCQGELEGGPVVAGRRQRSAGNAPPPSRQTAFFDLPQVPPGAQALIDHGIYPKPAGKVVPISGTRRVRTYATVWCVLSLMWPGGIVDPAVSLSLSLPQGSVTGSAPLRSEGPL
ncbi:hypothetical protein CP533_4335 [Ophiocordyceps camponoti-saundersi (nom. inval.)]|nr:hypothetical protein CP533_4335 [Ophiocordyceps camponoti-saundersi (nom. inval.)]